MKREEVLLKALRQHPEGLTAGQIRKLEPEVFSHQEQIARTVKRLLNDGYVGVRYDWIKLRPVYRYALRSGNPEDIQVEYGLCLAEKTRAYIIGRMVLAPLIWPMLEQVWAFLVDNWA